MKHWWLTLNQRERQMVIICGIALIAAVLYWGLYSPLSNHVAESEAQLERQQKTLTWAKQQGERILSAGGVRSLSAEADGDVNLNKAINASATSNQIVISRMQPRGESIDIWIDDVEFNRLITWLVVLKQKHRLTVENLDIVAKDTPGVVSVKRLRLGS